MLKFMHGHQRSAQAPPAARDSGGRTNRAPRPGAPLLSPATRRHYGAPEWRSTATAATATSAASPASGAGPAPQAQDSGPEACPYYATSTGLDFIDLVHLDERLVTTRLHEAVLFRTLVCSSGTHSACPTWRRASFTAASIAPAPPSPFHTYGAPATPAAAEPINVKRLKSYRDHVTRNLAPTVAKGFANAARAAGIILAAPPAAAETPAVPPPPATPSSTGPTESAASSSTSSTAVGPSASGIGGAASSPASRQQLQKQGQVQLQSQQGQQGHHHHPHHHVTTAAGGGSGGPGGSPSPRTATIVNATGSVTNGLSGSVAGVVAAAASTAAATGDGGGLESVPEPPRVAATVVAAAAAAWGPPPVDDSEAVGSDGGMFDF